MIDQHDLYKVIAILSLYGYHGCNHIFAMLEYEGKQEQWRVYCATILWSVGKMLSKEYPFPAYTEFLNQKPVDNRTTQEIVSGLIEKL